MLRQIWDELETDVVRARYWGLASWLNYLAYIYPYFHPSIVFAMARLEGGRSEFGTRDNQLLGITGEYGPQLSGRASEIFGIDFRVPQDLYHVRSQGNFRSYPTIAHAAADAVRMLVDSSVYSHVRWQADPATIVQDISQRWNSSPDYPGRVLEIWRRLRS